MTQLIAMARAEEAIVADKGIQGAPTDLIASASEAVGIMAPLAAARNVELAFEAEVDSAPIRRRCTTCSRT